MTFKTRLNHLLIATDQWLLALLTLGSAYPDETISSAVWRLEQSGRWQGKVFRPLIDFIWNHVFRIETEHCYKSYLSELRRYQLPPELRDLTPCSSIDLEG